MSARLNRFTLRSILAALLGFLVGLLANAFSVYLADPLLLSIVIGLAVLVFALYVVDTLRRPRHVTVRFGAPITLRKGDQSRYARKGLIAFVSLYNPSLHSTSRGMPTEKRLEAAASLDYAALDLENSNLETTIQAIRTHRDCLVHCWLIGTSGTDTSPGSSAYIPVLKEYLRQELHFDCVFHDGEGYEIPVDDDEQIYTKTYDLLEAVFTEATRLKLSDDDVVVDFTSGIRSMSLGAVLASLDGKRDIEFVGTPYDASGQIVPHELFTMIFNFEPAISED